MIKWAKVLWEQEQVFKGGADELGIEAELIREDFIAKEIKRERNTWFLWGIELG
jgi:hypothetical protein